MLMDSNEQPREPDFFNAGTDDQNDSGSSLPPVEESISWSASEFLHHEKSAVWYLSASAVIVLISALSYLLIGDLISPIAVIILGALLLVGAGRKPRSVEFTVDSRGIVAGNKEYIYDDFQSFAVIQEDQIESVVLYPQKRFAPEINMYFPPDEGQKIFDILSRYLPFEQREKDRIDKFLHKIRF